MKELGSMQPKSRSASKIEANPDNISPSAACSEPWWRSAGYNSIPLTVIGGNASNSSSLELSKDGQSQSDGGLDEEASPHSDGKYGQDRQNFQHQPSAIPPRSDKILTQSRQLELIGHSIACAPNPYQDPYYGGMMAAYGPQPLVPPHFLGMHHARMPLPLEMAQEPVYVNAKQYNGIMRRRQSRAKAEMKKKMIKVRKPYLHESRHRHAMRRVRGSGGRFAKKSDPDALKCTAEETGKALGSTISSNFGGSSGSESLQIGVAETQNGHEEAKGLEEHETFEVRGYANDGDQYQNRCSFQTSKYSTQSDKGGEGDPSGQQWGSISSNKASQRALAI